MPKKIDFLTAFSSIVFFAAAALAQTADQAWLRPGHFHGLPPVPTRVQALGSDPVESAAVKELAQGIDNLYGPPSIKTAPARQSSSARSISYTPLIPR